MSEKKGVGLNPNTYIHLTDHLAPICVIMGIPLLLTDEKHAEEASNLYPGLQTLLVGWEEVTPKYLIENFDVFFQSEPWNRQDFYAKFAPLEEKYKKVVRNVHCPHGFSDKLFWLKRCVHEDITLVYGQNMLDMFKDLKVNHFLNAYVVTGNYRYQYYQKHKAFYDRIGEEIWSRFAKPQTTILYAPTCRDPEKTTSLWHANPIFDHLPDDYNLLVKIHPSLEETDAPLLYRTIGKYSQRGNIVFVKDLPLVYPILERADIYLGDMSSIGYDFLVFNKPMFFLNQIKRDVAQDRNVFLYRCGVEVLPEHYEKIFHLIEDHLPTDKDHFTTIRTLMYRYSFGEEIPFEQLKEAIIASYSTPKKW